MEYLIVLILVLFSAIFSGLTLGFFSLNKDDLERKSELGDKDAKRVYKVRKNGNLLLCTLLIGNVAVNSTLSIFLGSIASGIIAGLIATTLIVIFGEIIPQAAFSRHALLLGSKFVWLIRFFIFILLPICAPIAWILDKVLGEEINTVYSKKELVKLIEKHEDLKESEIDADEERIMKGVLSFSDKKVKNIMTPRTEMIALPHDKKLTKTSINEIKKTGYSRIPIYKEEKDNIVGVLYVKNLIGDQWKNKTVLDKAKKNVIFVEERKPLDDLLEEFKKTRNHLFVVMDEYGGVAGVVTMEDVLEEIIGAEIVDEFDQSENLRQEARKKAKKINVR